MMKTERFLAVLLLGGAVAAGAALLMQRQTGDLLQAELGLARDEQKEIARLRAENVRIAATLPATDALATLRTDHAAVLRLRSELEKLKDNVQAREKAMAVTERSKGK